MSYRLWAAGRALGRSKRFALGAVLVLALGLSSVVVMFSVLDAVLLRPASFLEPKSVLQVQSAEGKGEWGGVPARVFEEIRARSDLFADTGAARMAMFTVTNVAEPDQVFGLAVTAGYFRMMGARALAGRTLASADERADAARVVLLSYRGWKKLFAGASDAVGKTISIDGVSYAVAGVMPADFTAPGEYAGAVFWVPLRLTAGDWNKGEADLRVVARVRGSVAQAAGTVELLGARIFAGKKGDEAVRLRAVPWSGTAGSDQRLMLWLAMAMTAGLLLIGCANLCSLLLARGVARKRDYAVSLALGARRADLLLQAFCEMLLVGVAGLAVALPASAFAIPLLRDVLPGANSMAGLERAHMEPFAVAVGAGAAMFCAMLCGLIPAWLATRMEVGTGLRESASRVAGSRPVRRFLRSVLALEAALSMVLLLTSLLLVRSLERLLNDDHGLRADHVLTMRLPSGVWKGGEKEADEPRRVARYLEMLKRAQAMPGVEAAALASSLPLSHTVVRTLLATPAGTVKEPTIMPMSRCVTREYFKAMGIPLLAGRTFLASEAASKVQAAVVNQSFADQYLRGGEVLGRVLRDPKSKRAIAVVGMVKDAAQLDLGEDVEPEIYFDFEQQAFTPALTGLVARTRARPEAMAMNLRRAVGKGEREQAVVHVATMDALIAQNTWQPRFSSWLFGVFAVLAVGLSALGIYGVVAYVAAASRKEFGIRLTLGEVPAGLFRRVAMQTGAPVLAGALAGMALSYWIGEWVRSILYRTSTFDVAAALGAIAILLLVTLAATAGPAWKAARVDPMASLRME